MRCPHCASSRVAPPVCRMCGKRLDEPAQQSVMPGLEPTRVPQGDADVAGAAMPGLERTSTDSTPDVAVAPMPGLETTGIESPPVVTEPMPGLVTNEEALGDTRIPDEPLPEAPRCPRCKVDVVEARFCPRCGYAVVVMKEDEATEGPSVICSDCGVPNPPNRQQCMGCGIRL